MISEILFKFLPSFVMPDYGCRWKSAASPAHQGIEQERYQWTALLEESRQGKGGPEECLGGGAYTQIH